MMARFRSVSSSTPWFAKVTPLALALTTALACHASIAATLGHSRLLSALGQPLRIDVQVKGLTSDEIGSLSVKPAAQADWIAAGLTPPVAISSLTVDVINGYAPGSKIIQVRSSQPFDQPIADLMLDVRTSTGQQRYQVSLLTQTQAEGRQVSSAAVSTSAKGGVPAHRHAPAQPTIRVRRGDTMFGIAHSHAVKDVTVFQMMMALQRANPQAFIEGNVNLVKEGARLKVPDMSVLTALSDKEARRLFQEQAQAFALYRQRHGAAVGAVGDTGTASSGLVSSGGDGPTAGTNEKGPQDQLRLSAGANGRQADDKAATRGNIDESVARVSQLEENVKNLNKALQEQGGAASSLVMEGARSLTDTLASATSNAQAGVGADGSGTAGVNGGSTAEAANASATDARTADGRGASGAADSHGSGSSTGGQANAASSGTASSGTASSGTASSGTASSGTASSGTASSGTASSGTASSSTASGGKSSTAGNTADMAASSGEHGSAALAGGASNANSPSVGRSNSSSGVNGQSVTGDTASKPGSDGNTDTGSASGIQSRPGAAAGQGGVDTPQGANGASSSNAAGANGSNAAPGASTSKEGQTVSWFQEHTLGVITGVLALIVLIIAWLLRRANSARTDGRDGVITETMVQEKLEQINLDLESSPDTIRSPRR